MPLWPNAQLIFRDNNGLTLARFNDFAVLTYRRVVNGIDTLKFQLDGDHRHLSKLATDRLQVEYWRRDLEHGLDWYREFSGHYRFEKDQQPAMRRTQAKAQGDNALLARRIVAWYAGYVNRSAFTSVAAQTIMKTLVAYNITTNATTGAGRLRAGTNWPAPYITVEVPVPSASPSASASRSKSPSASQSLSPSASVSLSPSASASPSPSISISPSKSVSPSASQSRSPSASVSPSSSVSASVSKSPSLSPSASKSPSASVSPSASASPSTEAGNAVDWFCAYDNLLETLQALAKVGGGDFALIKSNLNSEALVWDFRFYPGQLGTDRSASLTFAVGRGNMANPVYERDHTDEATVAIVGGQDTGVNRAIAVRTSDDFSTSNDIEMFVYGQNSTTAGGLNAAGDKRLAEHVAREEFAFDLISTDGCSYGRHFFLGDLGTAVNPFTGDAVTVKINAITIDLQDNGKQIISGEAATP